jgi:hypothetical protein
VGKERLENSSLTLSCGKFEILKNPF